MLDVDDEHHVGKGLHLLDTAQALLELLSLAIQAQDFLLGEALETTFRRHFLQRHKAFDGLANSLVIRQHAAQPPLADERHLAANRMIAHRVACRALGAHEKHLAAVCDRSFHESVGLASHRQALLEVDDVDSVSLAEDERSHLRVPVAGLVTKVHASL